MEEVRGDLVLSVSETVRAERRQKRHLGQIEGGERRERGNAMMSQTNLMRDERLSKTMSCFCDLDKDIKRECGV